MRTCIMTGKLFIKIIVGSGTIITPIVHGHEIKKANRWVLPVMLKKMRD